MHLKAIHLRHFRNLSDVSLHLHPRFNVLVGNNAQGKTNVLEGIYCLSFGKSFRLANYRGLIAWGKEQSFIRSWFESESGDEERNIHLTPEKKRFFKNGKPVSPNQFASVPMVLFAPEAILLLKESPAARRDYVDHLITECLPAYGEHLSRYKKALAQRNRILKEETLREEQKREQMILWEEPMAKETARLIPWRKEWIEKLNRRLEENYVRLAGPSKRAAFVYQPDVEPEAFLQKQAEMREEELSRAISLVGPHRDDFEAVLNDFSIKHFGSQGENRTFTLALKLAEISLFEEVYRSAPVLLLDDVVSELDESRVQFFFSRLESFAGQVFATAVSLQLFPKSCLKESHAWRLQAGQANLL